MGNKQGRHTGRVDEDHCQTCRVTFGIFHRRFHCHSCGHSFCNRCSSKQVAVPETENPARVCDPCNDTILADTPGPSGWSPGSGLNDDVAVSQVCAAIYNQDITNGPILSKLTDHFKML